VAETPQNDGASQEGATPKPEAVRGTDVCGHRKAGVQGGTESSNLLCSSGESANSRSQRGQHRDKTPLLPVGCRQNGMLTNDIMQRPARQSPRALAGGCVQRPWCLLLIAFPCGRRADDRESAFLQGRVCCELGPVQASAARSLPERVVRGVLPPRPEPISTRGAAAGAVTGAGRGCAGRVLHGAVPERRFAVAAGTAQRTTRPACGGYLPRP
jgi:hypothetical protein